jgi:hypothetical protein
MNNLWKPALDRLKDSGKYPGLVKKAERSPSQAVAFEVMFADAFESKGIALQNEARVNLVNDKTVDFVYQSQANERFCFELVSPEMSDRLKGECECVETAVEGLAGVSLSSNNAKEHLRPEAQTIELLWKLLEKVDKFSEPHSETFAIIVVNCSNFHFGHLDDEDCRMVMYGKTRTPAYQEYWRNNRGKSSPVQGMLDDACELRGARSFRRKGTAVIFVPKLLPLLLSGAYVVLNHHRSERHRVAFAAGIRDLAPFSGLCWISMAP